MNNEERLKQIEKLENELKQARKKTENTDFSKKTPNKLDNATHK